MAASSVTEKPKIGILSIGDMGLGMAKLLLDHGYQVYTCSVGRSPHTKDRIKSTKIHDLASDEELVAHIDILLSIVPPRDAIATARRVIDACKGASELRHQMRQGTSTNIVYVDMNAISPKTINKIHGIVDASHVITPPSSPSGTSIIRRFTRSLSSAAQDPPKELSVPPVPITLLDGGIIGNPPSKESDDTWKRPSVPISGPHDFLTPDLMSVLNMKHISDRLGTASVLKACFASMNKAFTGITTMAFTTAATAGILPDLKAELEHFNPGMLTTAERSMVSMPPKAYRWVEEMHQIGETFAGIGGLKSAKDTFGGIAELYRFVADETELGKERIDKRKRGTTSEDVAEAVREGVHKKKKEAAQLRGEEKLELAWRGSWS